MAIYTQLSRGSQGGDVKKLQQALMSAGYDVGASRDDGIYGSATQAAVRKYQQDNGLKVDGIAGNQTLSKLYTTNNTAQVQPSTTQSTSDYSYDPAADTAYQQALQALQQAQQNMPTYQGNFDQQIQDIYDKIVNRDKFSYDINSDVLYNQLADQYVTQGQMASQDVMGQAAAMTGGYGNSYSQSVGQQTYQNYLQQLNDRVPELAGMAFEQYAQEGQDLINQFAMLGDMKEDELNQYQAALDQYWKNVTFAKQQADDAYNQGYTASRDQIADKQWQAAFDYQQERDKVADAQREKTYNKSIRSSYTDNTGSDPYKGKWDNGNVEERYIRDMQKVLGVTVDGKWGKESRDAAGDLNADAALTAYLNGKFGPLANNDLYTLSDTAKKFMSTLPYAHAGSSIEGWKNVVWQRIEESRSLTKDDVDAIVYKLGLDK